MSEHGPAFPAISERGDTGICGGLPVFRGLGPLRWWESEELLPSQDQFACALRVVRRRPVVEAAAFLALAAMSATSAILIKRAHYAPVLAAVDRAPIASAVPRSERVAGVIAETAGVDSQGSAPSETVYAPDTRWFDGRPVRPARTIWMTVTAYSPDSRSCGEFADGQTATLHSVWTNGMKLVAADTRLLPYGSMLSVPGYGDGQIVPVLDCGGAIKGHHIDLLMPTHAQARAWGVRELPVTVWEYADGAPPVDPRTVR